MKQDVMSTTVSALQVVDDATEVIVVDVKPGMEAEFADWAARIDRAERAFPGYRASQTQAPPDGETIWTTLLHFASVEELEGWLHSEQRAALLEEAEQFVARVLSHRVNASFPGWTNSGAPSPAPSRWLTGALVLLTLFPIVMLEERVLFPLTAKMDPSPATFIADVLSVAVTTWPLMPLAIWAFQRFLFPKRPSLRLTLTAWTILSLCYAAEIAFFFFVK